MRFFNFSPSQITVEPGWAGRIRTFECQVQSLVPYQLGDRPAPLNSNAARGRVSPNQPRQNSSRRNTTRALSRRNNQSNLYGPSRRDNAVAPNLPGLFDFSSLRAGNAMLLMRFFAVNPPVTRACTGAAKLWISGYFVVEFVVEG
jgi:hypothetical protein